MEYFWNLSILNVIFLDHSNKILLSFFFFA